VKTASIVGVVVAAALAVGAVVWIAQSGPSASGAKAGDGTVLDPNAPRPKAVANELKYKFGVMPVGGRLEHTFFVTNEGNAPLVLTNEGASCTCTKNLFEGAEIAPGESAAIPVVWEPKVAEAEFEKHATVGTSDPQVEEIRFVISGVVETAIQLQPEASFDAGVVSVDEEVSKDGLVFSRTVKAFDLTIESEDGVESRIEPLTPPQLEEYGARAGYRYKVWFVVAETAEIERSFTLKTDADGGTSHPMTISGRSIGPLRVDPIRDVDYNRRANAIRMGRFRAAEGRTVELSLLGENPDGEPFEITNVDVRPAELDVTFERDERFRVKGKSRYVMSVSFPAGRPGAARTLKDSVQVVLSTNHPQLKEVKFYVEYIAD
jgi:hypothetical protein